MTDVEKADVGKYTSETLQALKVALTGVKESLDTRPEATGPRIPFSADAKKPVTFSDISYVCSGRVS